MDFRNLSPGELEHLGQRSLHEHLLAQATVAHQKYSPLSPDRLGALLQDPQCLRYPVRVAFEFGPMAIHQFAQPDIDWRNTAQDGRVLYVRPQLRAHPEFLLLVVAYMIPVINYGDIITDDHCLVFGATLLGLTEDEYYRQMCDLADGLGVPAKTAQELKAEGPGSSHTAMGS